MKTTNNTDIQLVITVALKKEVPLDWLKSHDVPVHTLSALHSGASTRITGPLKGLLVIITGIGLKASESAALWIRDNLSPLFVLNIGTCGVTDKKLPLSSWIIPQLVSDSEHTIKLDTRIPLPSFDPASEVSSLVSVEKPVMGDLPASIKKHDAIDMECYAQAKVFSNSQISFHCLKFSTDYSDSSTFSDFNKNLHSFQQAFKTLFNFISEKAPQISAIVPVYNREHTIRRAVDSILSQTCTPEEIIVVDDCSTDGTAKVLESYGSSIRTVRLPENSGPSAARNEGIRQSRSTWLAFVDSDDCWEKIKMEKQLSFLNKYPFYEILQSDEKWIRNDVRVNPCKHHQKPKGWIFNASLERCLISPSAVLLKKSLFARFGGFDENLPVCEDYDLWLKISRHCPVGLEPGLNVIKYGGHEDQLSHKYPAMDSFRVKSLAGILLNESDPGFSQNITEVLKIKLNILKSGYIKRSRTREAEECDILLQSLY